MPRVGLPDRVVKPMRNVIQMKTSQLFRFFAVVSLSGLLLACSSTEREYDYPVETDRRGRTVYQSETEPGVFGTDGILLVGEREEDPQQGGGGSGIGVNAYLWRASLDTLSFMPLASADPFGGVILTEWYTPPETPDERFKVNIFILGRDLRADGVRATVFRQERDQNGNWVDAEVEPESNREIEDSILTRARELRIAGLN